MSYPFDPKQGPILVRAEVTGPARSMAVRLILDTGATTSLLNEVTLTALGYDLASTELQERIARSKFREYPQFARLVEGHIALQHQGTEAWFRRIRVETF